MPTLDHQRLSSCLVVFESIGTTTPCDPGLNHRWEAVAHGKAKSHVRGEQGGGPAGRPSNGMTLIEQHDGPIRGIRQSLEEYDHLSKLAAQFCVPVGAGEVRTDQVQHLAVSFGEAPPTSVEGKADKERRPRRERDRQLVLCADQSEGLRIEVKPMELVAAQEVRDLECPTIAGASVIAQDWMLSRQTLERLLSFKT